MGTRRRVVIGLGSNLGDRAANLERSVARIRHDEDLHVLGRSPTYESAPVGGPPQGDYLNGAVALVTSLDATVLLGRLLRIEQDLGRMRAAEVRWGPRTIDLDLLWIEGEALDTPRLSVPHPRLTERAFALRPLLDLVPEAIDPRTGRRLDTFPAAADPLAKFVDTSA